MDDLGNFMLENYSDTQLSKVKLRDKSFSGKGPRTEKVKHSFLTEGVA